MSRRFLGRAIGLIVAAAALGGIGCGDEDRIGGSVFPDGGADDAASDTGTGFPDTGIGPGGELILSRVVPDHGPFIGGTRAVIRGSGFDETAVVTIQGRAVQPADTDLIDDNRISIVVPAGEVGPADVDIVQGAERATLPGGYTYDAIYVDPPSGSVAGGTFVNVVGSGTAFAAGDTVTFGRTECEGVEVVSETRMTCRTPPMAAGTVDVTVTHVADGSTTVGEDAYTYYDSADPFGGGLGGGPIAGTINVTALNAMSGDPVPDAFAIVGEDLATPHQGLTDFAGQITFSGPDLMGRQTITVAKHCFEKTSVVSFDATDVTVFLVPWMDPICGMGMPTGGGRGRNGAFISGELVWLGPNEYGPNPWANIPAPRAGEIKVAYVYTTQSGVNEPNPDPSSGGAIQRVLESPLGELGYPYRIFARPAGLAVYAVAGLENTETGNFIPYVMGVARNVLAGPGEEVRGVNVVMNIPLDHAVDVLLSGLPMPVRTGPDAFRVAADIDLGGEGVIVRAVHDVELDVVRQRSTARAFRFPAQPALFGALSDGRYRFDAMWATGDFDTQPLTAVVVNGVVDVSSAISIDSWLGIPQATSPAYGERLPADRVLRWSADGIEPDLHVVLMIGGDGNPAWRHFAPGNVREAPIPDLSTIPGIDDISPGFVTWVVYAIKIPGFRFDEFRYTYLQDRFWSHYAVDYFTAQQ